MATSLVIEEEHGTWTGHLHRHNGYYAGNFSTRPATAPAATLRPMATTAALLRPAGPITPHASQVAGKVLR